MKKIILFLAILLPAATWAQQTLKGVVKDADGHALDAATITLKQGDRQVAWAFADMGNFNLTYTGKGAFTLVASLVGYQTQTVALTLPQDSLTVTMPADNKQLSEVTVTYRRPLIERRPDRVTFNVESSILASGGSAWEALSKAPGVHVGTNNDITANRKNVRVFMDGKALNIAGDDLAAYLQGLPSDMVAQIEVYNNPPARFEAEGASIINIITKKAKKEGFNATLNTGLTQGIYSSYNANSTFNYRKNKLNVYGSYGFTRRHSFQDHDVTINFGDAVWSSPNRITYQSNNHNYRLGADYQLTSNQVLGVLVTGSNRSGNSAGRSQTQARNPQMQLDSVLRTQNYADNSSSQYAYNVNYNVKLDSGKRSFNIDLDYSPYQSSSLAYADNESYLPNGTATANQFHIYTPSLQNIDIYSGKADYTYHIGKWDVASGIKYSSTKSRNNFDYFDRDGTTLTPVPQNANHFTYREKTGAAYTSVARTMGLWSVQAGLRGELTHTNGYSATLDSTNQRKYFKLFPTVYLQYKPNANNEWQFTYAYRIERPEYNRLNPAKRYSSPYNIYVGNPALQPAFVHNIELGYTFKQQYNLTAFYTATHDVFSNINVQDNNTRIYYGTHANVGLSALAGLRVSADFAPLKWWSISATTSAYRQQEKSAYLSSSYNYHIFIVDGTLNQAFTINKQHGLKAELNAIYYGPGIQSIYRANHSATVDAGVKMNVLNGMGTVRLAVTDIFNSNNNTININYLDQHSSFFHHVESRFTMLSFAYRFGKNIAASRSRSTASEEERKRAQ